MKEFVFTNFIVLFVQNY